MKKLLLLIATLTFISTLKAQIVLYDQPSDGNQEAALPSNTILSPPTFGIYLAEDFTLTEANNILTAIEAFGYQEDEILPTIIEGLDVYIYNNVSGQNIPDGNPEVNGSGIYEFLNLNQGSDFIINNTGGGKLFNIRIDLTNANNGQDVMLPQGTYWVSIVPQIPFTGSSQGNPEPVWFWNWFRGVDVEAGNSAHIFDPSDYLSQGLSSSWTPIEFAGTGSKTTLAMTIEGQNELSISTSNKPNKLITVYPNPTSGLLHLKHPDHVDIIAANLYDALGKKYPVELFNKSFTIENLQDGVYVLSVETGSGIITQKIIKI